MFLIDKVCYHEITISLVDLFCIIILKGKINRICFSLNMIAGVLLHGSCVCFVLKGVID